MAISAREAGFTALRWSGLPWLVRELVQTRRVTLVIYHNVSPEMLDGHLETLGRRYNFVSLRDYVDARLSGRLDRLPRKALVVTLDDGLKIHRDLLDVLRKHSVTATMFLCADMVGTDRSYWWLVAGDEREVERLKRMSHAEREKALAEMGYHPEDSHPQRCVLSLEEIEDMRPFVDFQAHTLTHPILTQVPAERALSEIEGCRRSLEEDLGLDIYAFAYPNGSHTDRELGFVARSGYKCAVTTEIGFNGGNTDLLRLRRLCMSDDGTKNEVIVQASGVGAFLKRMLTRGTWRTEQPEPLAPAAPRAGGMMTEKAGKC